MLMPDTRLSQCLVAALLLWIATDAVLAETGPERFQVAMTPDVLIEELIAVPSVKQSMDATEANVLETYADIALAGYQDAFSTAKDLDAAINDLIADPSERTLGWAQVSWKLARIPYQQTEVFRFGNPLVDAWERRVNGWPLDAALIDYVQVGTEGVENSPGANVVANAMIMLGGVAIDASEITPALLRLRLQGAAGVETRVATGYHAIEFLLWGQDLNGSGRGAGLRPVSDYAADAHAGRRAAYLKAASTLLVSDLQDMVADWKVGGAAREALPKLGISAILTGIASLGYGELAGDRMQRALLRHDAKAEHDVFSDYTHVSFLMDGVGMRNVYLGRYLRTDGTLIEGPSLSALIATKDATLDAEITALIVDAVAKLTGISNRAETQGETYDRQIADGNVAGNAVVQAAIDALIAQTRGIERAVALLELGNTVTIKDSDALRDPDAVLQ